MWFLSALPLVGKFFDWLNKREDTELEKYKVKGEVDKEALKQDTEIIKARADLAKARSDSKTDSVGRALLVWPTGIWFSFIVYHTLLVKNSFWGQFAWEIPDLPPSVQYVPLAVVGYLLATNWKSK